MRNFQILSFCSQNCEQCLQNGSASGGFQLQTPNWGFTSGPYWILASPIVRCRSLKMVGVDIADDFSVTQHVQRLVTSSAQKTYAIRVLRCHGLSNTALQLIYQATVIAHLMYATSAWCGFTKASDC